MCIVQCLYINKSLNYMYLSYKVIISLGLYRSISVDFAACFVE